MRVLGAVGSKHGATAEIGATIGGVLTAAGLDATVVPIEDAAAPSGYDAAIIGSAVYAGQWTKAARRYVEANQDELAERPVWLFSSGPIGDPPKPDEDPSVAADFIADTGAADHHVFAGKLDRDDLGFAERAIVRAFKAPDGDFRDWEDVRTWAEHIILELKAQ